MPAFLRWSDDHAPRAQVLHAQVLHAGPSVGEALPMLNAAWIMAKRWRARILLAVVDQGVASGTNFLLTILYASWLPLESFGRYVIVWSISVLIETALISLILDSMPAIASRCGPRNRRRLDIAGVWVVLIYSAATSVLILASLPFVARWVPEFTTPLLCLAAANPLLRLYIFLRRLCYIRDRQDIAAKASVTYGGALLLGAAALHHLNLLTVPSAVLLWGLGNGLAALTIQVLGVASFCRTRPVMVLWLMRRLWQSGRWLAGAAIGFWITTWGMFPLVAAVSGTEAAGVVRALQNLFTPIVQFNAALNLAILPRVADKVVTAGAQYARRFAIYATTVFTAIVVVYAGVVIEGAPRILTLLYRRPEILSAVPLLWPLGLAMVLESARQGSSMSLLAVSRTQMFFVSRAIGVTVFLAGVLAFGRTMGAEGILWSNVAAHAIGTGLLLYEALSVRAPSVLRTPRWAPAAGTSSQQTVPKLSS